MIKSLSIRSKAFIIAQLFFIIKRILSDNNFKNHVAEDDVEFHSYLKPKKSPQRINVGGFYFRIES